MLTRSQILLAGEKAYLYVSLSGLVRLCGEPGNDHLDAAEAYLKHLKPELEFDLHAALDAHVNRMKSDKGLPRDRGARASLIISALAPTALDEVGKTHIRTFYGDPGYLVFVSAGLLVFAHQLVRAGGAACEDLLPIIIGKLTDFFRGLGLSFPPDDDAPVQRMEAASKLLENFCESKSPRLGSTRSPGGRSRVFLVHGHDTGALSTVARFLERLGLDVVVLHEQPNSGRTIIEKFIDYSDVEYAVVLLTPDDRGGLASDRYEQQRSRARQNVVFELGYFVGKLGRDRVCALYECTVEVPSDYSGVVFVPLDAQAGWRTALASELRAAGVNIQIDRILA